MKNDIVRVKCVDMSVDGLGIAKVDNLVVFVKGLIVDEEAYIKIIKEKSNYSIGIIEEIIKESPHRIRSDCPISYKCGGCDFRYIDYDFQLNIKKKVLLNTFKNYLVRDIVKDDNPFYYRNKVQVPVYNNLIGFYRKNSNDIVEFDDCLIESKLANEIIKDLKPIIINNNLSNNIRHIIIKHAQGTDEIMIGFVVRSFDVDMNVLYDCLLKKFSNIKSIVLNLNNDNTNVILGKMDKVIYGNNYIYDVFDGIKVKLSLKSFYQVNYYQMLKLYSLIKDLASVSKSDNVLDLYCGIGTISLYLARYVNSVTGVEIVEDAVNNARDNAKLNNLDNANFILADANKTMDDYIKYNNIVILDPPRKGISKDLAISLIDNNVDKIVYVSCNPATLARDLDYFKDKYNISDIHPVDMFPFTTHIECCVRMTRKDIISI